MGLLYYNSYGTNGNKQVADTGIAYLVRSINIARHGQYQGALSSGLVLKGNFLSALGRFNEAEQDLQEGISIRKKIGDPFYIMQDLINISSFYYTRGQHLESITSIEQAISISRKSNILIHRNQLLYVLGENYKALHKYKEYSSVLESFISLADSNSIINSSKQLAEIQTKYDIQKKQAEIAQQKLTLLRRNYWLYGSLAFILLGLVMGYIGFANYKAKQSLKMELALQQEKREKELAVRFAEENERIRIAADLHDNIGVQASAFLYGTELLQKNLGDSNLVVENLHNTAKEMLLNLRDTVWAMKNSDISASDLWIRVINFCKQMGRHYSGVKLSVTGLSPEGIMIESAKALNILMIIQEAVNNSAKHSESATIEIVSEWKDNEWNIKITDAGRGFDVPLAIQNNEGNGLDNMIERAKLSNTFITLESAPTRGSVLTLLVPFG
jgi:signal transduction histidine kinase